MRSESSATDGDGQRVSARSVRLKAETLLRNAKRVFITYASSDRSVQLKAEKLLRNAKRVFIAYASSDLARTRDLRARILKMRRPAAPETVFMASDSLPIGEAVDPSHIRAKLREADLFVLACGIATAKSPWVAQEVEQALEQRSAGATQILPVILKHGVTLPRGIDFAIQAIHFDVLFPVVRRIRIAAVGLVVVLAGSTLASWAQASRATHGQRLDALKGKLQSWDLESHEATNLIERDWLADRRLEAERLADSDLLRTIDQRLSRYATADLRRPWLPADSSRQFLVVDPRGEVVWLGYADRIEKRAEHDGTVLGQIALDSFTVAPFRADPIMARRTSVTGLVLEKRAHGRLVALVAQSRVRGVLAEVEYPDGFADPSKADEFAAGGYSSAGGEREILLLSPDTPEIQSVGISVELTAEHDATGEIGSYDTKVSRAAGIDSLLSQPTEVQRNRILNDWMAGDEIERIAVNPRTGNALFHVMKSMGARDNGGEAFSFQGWIQHYAVRLRPDGRLDTISTVSNVFPAGRRMSWPDGPNPFVALAPNYRPAVDGPNHAVMEYALPLSASAVEARTAAIKELWFASDGARLRVRLHDGSVATAPGEGSGPVRRFGQRGARAIDIASDGRRVFVLNASGGVDTWDVDQFDEDGWLAPRIQDRR